MEDLLTHPTATALTIFKRMGHPLPIWLQVKWLDQLGDLAVCLVRLEWEFNQMAKRKTLHVPNWISRIGTFWGQGLPFHFCNVFQPLVDCHIISIRHFTLKEAFSLDSWLDSSIERQSIFKLWSLLLLFFIQILKFMSSSRGKK